MSDPLERLRSALADRYDIERQVGEGGMATVYLARDLKHERQVAIKLLRAELAASIGADRFLREIKLAANLQHPNILALYDSGEADGFLYYVMPFVEGESLRDRLNREQQLPLHDAVRITREAAEALAYAHEHGVVHRDIKPENILLQNGHALVADFGIARALDAAGEKLTQTGMAVGTPHYMSPEQALGGEHVDGRSDVYSLGCVLYELLIGQPPFGGPNAMAIMARHSMEAVPSLQVVRQSVPDDLEDAVMQALEKTPADRFQKMSEFADLLADLEPTLATRRTSTRGVQAVRRTSSRTAVTPARISTPAKVVALAKSRGVKFWSVAGAVLLIVAGLTVWRVWGKPGEAGASEGGLDVNRIAVLYFEKAPGGSDSVSYLADGLTEALIHELSGVQGLQVISSNGVRPFKKGDVPLTNIAKQLQVGTLVHGDVAQSGDRLRVNVALVNPNTGVEIGSKTLERPRAEIFALQDDLAKEVSVFLRQQLGQEVQVRESRVGTDNVKAWETLQRAEAVRKDADTLLATGDTTGAARKISEADSVLAMAQTMDPRWTRPFIERGWLDYRRTDLIAGFDKSQYSEWLSKGLAQAEGAIKINPTDPDALELRGTLTYWRWLLNLEPGDAAAAKLVASAESDLRAAVTGNPQAAVAWAWLSHLLMGQSRSGEAKLAALKSYEADPYLSSAKQTVWRLFQSSMDLEDAVEARHWCEEGARRFPDYYRFTECRIWLYALKGQTPAIDTAWADLTKFVERTPPSLRPYHQMYGQMLVAMALARAGKADSARALAKRSRGDATLDPTHDLAFYEAIVRTMLGDKDEALSLLSTYYAANPQLRAGMSRDQSWWFKSLRDDPRYKALLGGGPD